MLNSAARGNALGYFFVQNPELVSSLSGASIVGAALSGTFWPLTSGFGATQILALVLIITMTLLLFFQQRHMMLRNMPPSALEGPMGQQQKTMLYMMPLMYVFAGGAMPVGVLVYWMMSNLWTLVQQWIIIRTYPTPGTPAYVDWEERMIARGKDPKAIERRRADRARKTPRPSQVATPSVTDDEGRPMVSRQKGVSRQTVRKSRDGRQVVRRQQVQRESRARRKKM